MRIVGVLNFYDEPSDALSAYVASIAPLVDVLVATAGAYELFPGPVTGPPETHQALRSACEAHGLPLDLVVPKRKWRGNQLGKLKNIYRRVRKHTTTHVDWVFIMDADERIVKLDADAVHSELYRTRAETMRVRFYTERGPARPMNIWEKQGVEYRHPRFFRALKNLRPSWAHWCLLGEDVEGETVSLKGHPIASQHGALPAIEQDLQALMIMHHLGCQRDKDRVDRKIEYLRRLHAAKGETGTVDPDLRRLGYS